MRSRLGMRVVAYDPFVAAERFSELGVEPAALDDVYAAADVITLHLPLTRRDAAARSGRGALADADGVRIVNAARGELVDEEALLEALRSGKVAGAALDVFATEPYAGPLLERRAGRRHAAPRGLDERGAGSCGRR